MWQRFSERARKVVFYAQEEAQSRADGYVSTEHLLLGLLRDEETTAGEVLRTFGVASGELREAVERQLTHKGEALARDMALSPRAKRVIDLAYDESRSLRNNHIGTEHLLLGLIRERDGLAGRVLAEFRVDLELARRHVAAIQEREGTTGGGTASDLVSRIVSRFGFGPKGSAGTTGDAPRRHNNAIWERCTPRCRAIIDSARTKARQSGAEGIGAEHLILALLDDPECRGMRAIASLEPDLAKIRRMAEALAGSNSSSEEAAVEPIPFSPSGQTTISAADIAAWKMGNPFVGTEHLALVLFGGAAGEVADPEALLPNLVRVAVAAFQAED